MLTASHDLLAPLNNIEASISIMNELKSSENDGLGEFLAIINNSIKNFRSLINDIASIAKVENEMIETALVDIDGLINNVVWSLEAKINSSGAVINRDLGVKQIQFSKKNLRSILFNLISNAIKFTGDKKPIIEIKTATEDGHTVLSVQDNGVGISAAGLKKVFEKYSRLNEHVEGQGIGLYLAKKIINAAGGQINVHSEPGKGSKFSLYFNSETESQEFSMKA